MSIEMVVFIFSILLVGVVIFMRYYHRKTIHRLFHTQASMLEEHAEEVENIYRHMRGWRHDYKNHIQTMKAYIEMNKIELLQEYLEELDDDLVAIDVSIHTGNVMADAILNSKLSLAEARNIQLDVKASIPSNLPVHNVDLGTLLGNLLSNAIEGSQTVVDPSNRFIRVYIVEMKEQLYISITNSMNQTIKKKGTGYQTTKKGTEHGFGLKRIDQTVHKYQGHVNRKHEVGVFATEILLPL